MIGSVHGCVSCPVVVKPWEPESISRPQHPLPSLSLHQSHPYSLPQRSSSVHPLPQKASLGDKVRSSSLSPQRLPSVLTRHSSPFRLDNTKDTHPFASEHEAVEKTSLVSCSLSKTASPNGSPRKSVFVFKSPQDIALQYEQLLRPRSMDCREVSISSHKMNSTSSQQNESCDEGSSHCCKTERCLSESQTGGCELSSSLPKPDAILGQHLGISLKNRNISDKSSKKRKDQQSITGKTTKSASKNTPPSCIPHSSNIGSPPQLHRMTFSPAPLPAIQDRSKISFGIEAYQEPSHVHPLSSVIPSIGLSSLSSPKFQAVGSQMSTPPPRPSLLLMRDRKRQTKRHGRKDNENTPMHEQVGDSAQRRKLEERRESAQKEQQLASGIITQQLPYKISERVDIVIPYSHKVSETRSVANKDAIPRENIQTTANVGVASETQTHPPRETQTPQSLDSSSWSLGQTTVAPEVDALTTAAAAGDMLKVKSLLAGGVNVNAVNTFGRTAIQVMTLDNTDLAEVLLKAGANPNMQDEGRRAASSTFRTIAHDVAASGYTDMLRCLLRHGADVNFQDRWGNTPLHLAAKGGHLAAVRLLRRGTYLHQPNQQGKTPIKLLEETGNSAAKQWVELKKSTVSHLQTLCVLAVRQELGPHGLRCWRKHFPTVHLQRQILLQSRGGLLLHQPSISTLLSSRHSAGSRSLVTRGRGNGNGHPLVPGMAASKQMTDFLTLRDLIPRRLSMGENTSLEVHNTSSGQSNDDMSLCARATSSLASETGSLFETNLSSIDASQSADELSLPSFDQSL